MQLTILINCIESLVEFMVSICYTKHLLQGKLAKLSPEKQEIHPGKKIT
jgi:hypothetical protein